MLRFWVLGMIMVFWVLGSGDLLWLPVWVFRVVCCEFGVWVCYRYFAFRVVIVARVGF